MCGMPPSGFNLIRLSLFLENYVLESGKIFLSLLSIIKQWVLPGTTIISECWKAYNILEKEGYKHMTVNHSLHFKDPETGAHTNTIETMWRHGKHFLPEYCRKKDNFIGYLSHYVFYKSSKQGKNDLFNQLLEENAEISFDSVENQNIPNLDDEI